VRAGPRTACCIPWTVLLVLIVLLIVAAMLRWKRRQKE